MLADLVRRIPSRASYGALGILLFAGCDTPVSQPRPESCKMEGFAEIDTSKVEATPRINSGDSMVRWPLSRRYLGDVVTDEPLPGRSEALLRKMWDEKMSLTRSRTREGSSLREDVARLRRSVLDWYDEGRSPRMSLDSYVHTAQASIDAVRSDMDWDVVGRNALLSDEETDLVRDVSGLIDGADLVAYGLTEIGDARHDGSFNAGVLDHMLRHSGRDYVESLPSFYDARPSKGLYQLTPAPLADGRRRGGVTAMEEGLRDTSLHVPSSLAEVRGDDHHRAAYLFAVSNIAGLVRNTEDEHHDVLRDVYRRNEDDVMKYVALSHNDPAFARRLGKQWLDCSAAYDMTEVSFGSKASRKRVHMDRLAANLRALKPGLSYENRVPEDFFVDDDGDAVFSHTLCSGETVSAVAESFNRWDAQRGDVYSDVRPANIVVPRGRTTRTLRPGDVVSVYASRR